MSSLLIGIGKPVKEGHDEYADDEETSEGPGDDEAEKVAVAKDALEAFKTDDAEALSMALTQHYNLCKESSAQE